MHDRVKRGGVGLVAVAVAAAVAWGAAARAADHPFILWTADEAAAIRRRIETETWARAAYERLGADKGRGDAAVIGDLLRYSAMGDRAVGENQKAALLAGGRGSSAHVDALRYDVLYGLLAPAEREKVEQRFRREIEDGIRSTQGHTRNRWNWLPNLQYVWYLGRHLQAVALGDPDLVRKVFHSDYGMEWYVGTYLSDMGFYNEEFGKSNWYPALALLYAEGCRRLGLDEVGYGFCGRSGQSIRGSLEAYLAIGYPRVDLGTGRCHYATVTMGDAKNQSRRFLAGYVFQQANIDGYRTDGAGGATRAYGSILSIPHWFELAHRRWPDAGFDYFLAEMRGPGDDRYYPSLFFGLEPVDPGAAKPPPAPSGVYRERGFAMLRAEEGPGCWQSAAPAVALRLATPYAHHVEDDFSLLGLYAFNRPIYINHSHSTNYSGVDPQWSNSMRSHSGVIVDYREPQAVGEVPSRSHFSPLAKFAAARARDVYPDVDQTRALVLTREYLLDVFALASPRPRRFQWTIQTFGHACPDRPTRWAATRDLVGSIPDLGGEMSWSGDESWAVTAVQTSAGADPELSGLGEAWFEDRVGSRITMLGAPETAASTALSPVLPDSQGRWMGRERFMYGADEPGGIAVVAARRGRQTAFVALHEPFRTIHRIVEFRRIQETPDGVAVAVVGVPASGVNDRVMISIGDAAARPMTLAGAGEVFTFTGYGFVRVVLGRVDVAGDLAAMRLQVGKDRPALYVNGEAKAAEVDASGALMYGSLPAVDAGAAALPAPLPAGPIAAWWRPETAARLPTGGQATVSLTLRNGGLVPVTMKVRLAGSEGLRAEPAVVDLKDFRPGEEKTLAVRLAAAPETANRLLRLEVAAEPGSPAEVQPAPLPVAHGVVSERGQFWPADFNVTVYAPRYLARYDYMESGAAALLLDPDGLRRTGPEADTWPELLLAAKDDQGRESWRREKVARFAYFIPVLVRGEGGPAYLYEGGRHAHGAQSMLEHWFTEDWIVARYRQGQPGDRVILNWFADARRSEFAPGMRPEIAGVKRPGKLLVATESGGIVDGGDPAAWGRGPALPKDAGAVVAVLRRPAGFRYGECVLFAKGAELTRAGVVQPADSPMGFTYATEEEFPALVEKWRRSAPSGQADAEAVGRYGGAFMPKPKL